MIDGTTNRIAKLRQGFECRLKEKIGGLLLLERTSNYTKLGGADNDPRKDDLRIVLFMLDPRRDHLQIV